MRVALLGNSGSGKSTLAAALSRVVGVETLDLDVVAWEAGQVAVARDEALAAADVRAFCAGRTGWVVEGCYAELIEVALSFRPRLVFLNPGMEICLANCRARPWEPHKFATPEEQEARLPFLLNWVREYFDRVGPLSQAAHRACFEAYTGPKREVRTPLAVADLDPEFLAWACNVE